MAVYDFTKIAYRNDTFRLPVAIEDSEGTAIDLTGATVKLKLSTITEATSGVSISWTDRAGGEFTIQITPAAMTVLEAGKYDMGVQIVYADTTVETILFFEVDLRDGVAA